MFNQKRNQFLRSSHPSNMSHRPLTLIAARRRCKRAVRSSRRIKHSVSFYRCLQISGGHKNTISHFRTGLLITVLQLQDSNQTWSSVKFHYSVLADVSDTPARVPVPISPQHCFALPALEVGLMLLMLLMHIRRSY